MIPAEENHMSNEQSGVSKAFQLFLERARKHAGAWMTAVQALGEASSLDRKTSALAYPAVLAALRLDSGVLSHVKVAKGRASRDEVISAPQGATGGRNGITQSLPRLSRPTMRNSVRWSIRGYSHFWFPPPAAQAELALESFLWRSDCVAPDEAACSCLDGSEVREVPARPKPVTSEDASRRAGPVLTPSPDPSVTSVP
jgi:alkylhydroperoxidase/carboxymuconolactone decarboxylase family protein YurZ